MSKVVYIAEKPSVAKSLADFLKVKSKKSDHYICEGGIVTWLYGHMLELVNASDYDERYGKWVLDDLPILPDEFKLRPVTDKKMGKTHVDNKYKRDHFFSIKKLISDADEVVIATDPDAEGELLGMEVIYYLDYKGTVSRILPTSLDDQTLSKCISNKFPAIKTDNLYKCGLARSHMDWIVGINVTRGLTTYNAGKINTPLNAGRVQSGVISILYENYISRLNFKAKPVYSLSSSGNVDGEKINFRVSLSSEDKLVLDANDEKYDPERALSRVSEIVDALAGKSGVVESCKKERKKTPPPLGYQISELQQECSKKFGYSAAETLAAVQKMYEAKIVTYPRTDCSYMPEPQHQWAEKIIGSISKGYPELNFDSKIDLSRKTKTWNDKKIENHNAIMPTEVVASNLNDRESEVYKLIAKRYIVQFMEDYEYDRTEIVVDVDGWKLNASGNVPVKDGWKAVADVVEDEDDTKEKESSQSLPLVNEGTEVNEIKVSKEEKKTTKPPLYTEAKLLSTLEKPYRLMKNKELSDTLRRREKGIGTGATIGNILANMERNKFFSRNKKSLELTDKGIVMGEITPPDLLDIDLTAELEVNLKNIEAGESTYESVITRYKSLVEDMISSIKSGGSELKKSLVKTFPCTACEKGSLVRRRRKSDKTYFWVCLDCNTFYNDKVGRPVEQPKKSTEKHNCPSCDGVLGQRFRKSDNKPFWGCSNWNKKGGECRVILDDNDGRPMPKPEPISCTSCADGVLSRRNGKYGYFWGCSNWNKKGSECKVMLKDKDGKPVSK